MNRIKYCLLMLALCWAASVRVVQAQSGDAVVITVDVQNGTCLRGGTTAVTDAGSYFSRWTSTQETPQLTLTTPNNDMWIATDGTSIHFFGSKTFTLTASEGYVIVGYSFSFEGYGGNSNAGTTRQEMTVTSAAGPAASCTTTAAGHLTVSGLEVGSTSFTVTSPSSGTGNVVPTDFRVTLMPEARTLEPFVPTTITAGEFAPGTVWYTMTLMNARYQAVYEADNRITLSTHSPLSADDAALWCFAGNRTEGYRIYNKAAGAGKCLTAARSTLKDGAVPMFRQEEGLDTEAYESHWLIKPSATSVLGSTAAPVYLQIDIDGEETYALNDFQEKGQVKFWSGRGSRSTFAICEPQDPEADGAHTVVVFDNSSSDVPYRIPAIAKTADGRLILVVDYRYCKSDIGYGPIDLRYKVSADNGRTWSEEYANLGDGDESKSSGNQWDYAFGDPSIVADCENPNEVLVLAVGGHVPYFSSTYDNPQHVVRFRSHDGGRTWTKGENITYQIYDLYENSVRGKAVGIFLTSGRIMQSRYVKVGDYYRLYIAHPFRGENGQCDYVIYSDDFGETWQVLGGTQTIASTGADESKVEELPDGSVLISSRVMSGGRVFNVFTYTDSKRAEGYWSSSATPELMRAGLVNACNGGVLVVPARRKADGKQLYVALQSVPQSSRRELVGFYYKELPDAASFYTGPAMAEGWKKGLCVTPLDACYSEMLMMDNDSIAFVYEETLSDGGFDIIFKSLSLDTITGGLYSYDPAFTDRSAYFEQALQLRLPETVETGTAVGYITDASGLAPVKAAFESGEKTQQGMEAVLDTYYNRLPRVELIAGRPYRLQNAHQYATGQLRYLRADGNALATTLIDTTQVDELFTFVPTDVEGEYILYNPQRAVYADTTRANEAKVLYTDDLNKAARYRLLTQVNGQSALVCTTPLGAKAALHCASDGRIVPWDADALASRWYVEPVRVWRISLAPAGEGSAAAVYYPFAYEMPDAPTRAYAAELLSDRGLLKATELVAGVAANTPAVIVNSEGATLLRLRVPDVSTAAAPAANSLSGTVATRTAASAAGPDNTLYALSQPEGKPLGFYPSTAVVRANTSYLATSMAPQAEWGGFELFPSPELLPVSALSVLGQSAALYDLQGRRQADVEQHGVFIQGGKKVLR